MNLRGQELLIILLIILLIFGARKLPDLARSIGASAKEFRKGVEEGSKGEALTAETSADRPVDEVRKTESPESPDS